MHRIIRLSALVLFMALFLATAVPAKADRRDLYCYLQAATVDVRVEVWEEDRRGNKGQVIWRGLIEKGTKQRINTRTGGIRYGTTIYVDTNESPSGDTSRWCEEGLTIAVP